MWIFFLLIHLAGLVCYNIVLRHSLVKKSNPIHLATIMQTAIAVPAVIALFFYQPDINIYGIGQIMSVLLISTLVVALHLTNVYALRYLEAGVFSILYNIRIIITTVLGVVFLGEKIIPLQIIGGVFIFLSIIAVRQKGKKSSTAVGVMWGLAASLVISFLNLFEKQLISDIGYMEYAIPVMILSSLMLWGVMAVSVKEPLKPAHFLRKDMLGLMFFRVLSAYGFTLAFYAGGLLSVSSYISSLGAVLIVIVGMLVLKESDYAKQKMIAICMAALGVTAIFLANIM